MDIYSEIRRKIKGISFSGSPTGGGSDIFLVKVTAVKNGECAVEYDGMELTGVRLRSVINAEKSKIVITPKTGSYVLVADISGNLTQLVVLQYAEVDKIELNYSGQLVINEGTDTAVRSKALEDKLNALKESVNALIDKFNSHTHTIPSGGIQTAGSATAQANTAPVNVPAITGTASKAAGFNKTDFECKTVNL